MQILVASGGDPHTDATLRLGGRLAETLGVSMTVLTVVGSERECIHAEAILTRSRALLPDSARVETKLRVGQRAREIVLEVAQREREGPPVLLLLGERPCRGLARRLLAPTVERVLQQMPCPVLIVRGRAQLPRRLLLCESGRDPSLLARLLSRLEPLLLAADALTVLHVMSQIAAGPGVPGWELRADAEALIAGHTLEGILLEDDLAQLRQLPAHLEAKVRHGLVVKEILHETRCGNYDLVVIGAHQGNPWEKFLLDNLAQEIVDHAELSVLVV
jgi:nucleotide-binding universal stress UspA family protein